MASIDYIRSVTRNILDKDGHGWIGDNKFNNILTLAQDEVFNDIYSMYTMALAMKTRNLEFGGFKYSGIDQIVDDLKPLKRNGVSLTQITDNKFSYPSDYRYFVSLGYKDKAVDILKDTDNRNAILNSVVSPTERYPAARLNYNEVVLYPTTITADVEMDYYKNPRGVDANGNPVNQSPTWAYTVVNGKSIYNPSASIQPELPESTYNKIIVRILSMYGINIREMEVVQYANNEEVKNRQNQ